MGCNATPVLEWNEHGSIFDDSVSEELEIQRDSAAAIGAGTEHDSRNSMFDETVSGQLEIQAGCTVIGAGMEHGPSNSTLGVTLPELPRNYGGNTSIPMELNSWTPHWHIFDNQGRAVGFRTYAPEDPLRTPRQFAERLQGLSVGCEGGGDCDNDERMRVGMRDGCAFEDGGTFDPRVLLQQPEWRALHPFRLQEDVDGYVEATERKDSAVDLGPRASGMPRGQRFCDGQYVTSGYQPRGVPEPTQLNGVVHEWLEAQLGQGVQSPPTPVPTEYEQLGFFGAPTLTPEPKPDPISERCDVLDPLAIEEYLLACAVEWKGMSLEERREMVRGHFSGARSVRMGGREMLGLPLPLGEEGVAHQTSMGFREGIGQGKVEPDIHMDMHMPQRLLGVDSRLPGSASPTRSEMESEPGQQRSSVPAQRVTPPGNRLPAVKRWNGRPALQARAGLGSNSGMSPEEWVEHRRKGKNESQKMKRKEQRERKAGKV
ncbi:hypothetical protein LTR17_007386 [Elasticomyces elasticus]|nr:hypothetical protein LTR17_007386 [Elasticomyces elasticus]